MICFFNLFSLIKIIKELVITKIAPNKWWPSWKDCSVNGYNKDIPVWLSTWLLIITDNTIHLIINYLALKYL